MTDRAAQRSPLAMMVLALLQEEPMHPYRVHELILERGKATVVNVAQRNSVYQVIERLTRAKLVEVHATSRDEGRPERVAYRATEAGASLLRAWLAETLSLPKREFPEFPAALSVMMLLPPREVVKCLEARRTTLDAELGTLEQAGADALARGLPRLFLVEDEYRGMLLRAESAWLSGVIADLHAGKLTWSKAWLRKVATAMAGAFG
jgi:DNA-binding PadR family transcriptional regulator